MCVSVGVSSGVVVCVLSQQQRVGISALESLAAHWAPQLGRRTVAMAEKLGPCCSANTEGLVAGQPARVYPSPLAPRVWALVRTNGSSNSRMFGGAGTVVQLSAKLQTC